MMDEDRWTGLLARRSYLAKSEGAFYWVFQKLLVATKTIVLAIVLIIEVNCVSVMRGGPVIVIVWD